MSEYTNFSGTGVAMVTPFLSDGSVDYERLETHTDQLIEHGTGYLVVLGTTAETPVLTEKEKLQIIDVVKKANSGRVSVVVGAGSNNTSDVVRWIGKTGSSGIDAYLSVVPYYNKPGQTGIKQHFNTIAATSDRPIILYNVPGRTGSNMTAETTLEIAHESGSKIAAVKEASGDLSQIMRIISEKPDGFKVLSGDDAITLAMIGLGGDGVISVIGNAFPGKFSSMVRHALGGDFKEARKIHYTLLPFMEKIFQEGNPTGIKTLMEILGFGESNLRLPLIPASRSLYAELEKMVKEIY
ncbi:MAG: 4-hydroxy-tetrahydrodipicolinate synthase [Bacteroidales bacterium]|nr:4-hydroxy-tetrahydrodipicolinate synthase [Bacteroidales bacterium]